MNQTVNPKPLFTTYELVLIALVTAVTCILAPFSIPLPISPVPISFTNLVLYVSIYLLGWKRSTISYIIYLLLGFAGLPVFSGFTGGIGKLAGPTGGYLIGFLLLTVIAGLFVEHFPQKRLLCALGMILGTIVTYIFGTFWLSAQLHMTFTEGLAVGALPYLPGDIIKIGIALIIGPAIKARVGNLRV